MTRTDGCVGVTLANFLALLSQVVSGLPLATCRRGVVAHVYVPVHVAGAMMMVEPPGPHGHGGQAVFAFVTVILLCFLPHVGSSCDFDVKWAYEDRPCSAWNLSLCSDGKPGFRIVEGSDVVMPTNWVDMVRNGPPPVHNPPVPTDGKSMFTVSVCVCVSVCVLQCSFA